MMGAFSGTLWVYTSLMEASHDNDFKIKFLLSFRHYITIYTEAVQQDILVWKVMCLFCFEIFTPEGRAGVKGGSANFKTKHTAYQNIRHRCIFGSSKVCIYNSAWKCGWVGCMEGAEIRNGDSRIWIGDGLWIMVMGERLKGLAALPVHGSAKTLCYILHFIATFEQKITEPQGSSTWLRHPHVTVTL